MVEGSCSSLEPYALRVLGDSMEPEFADGCVIIVDPATSLPACSRRGLRQEIDCIGFAPPARALR